MFPNVRLMVAAVLATVVALSCGFGIFAAFRINHDPLARLQGDTTPLHFAADNPIPPLASGGNFGVRYQVIQTQFANRAARVSMLKVDLRDSVAAPSAISTTGRQAGSTEAAQSAAVVSSPLPDAQPPTSAAEPAQTAALVPSTDTSPDTTPPDATPPATAAAEQPAAPAPAPDAPPATDAAAPEQAAAVAQAPAAEAAATPTGTDEARGAAPPVIAPQAVAAIEAPADQAQPSGQTGDAANPATNPQLTPATAAPQAGAVPAKVRPKAVHKIASRPRVVRVSRVSTPRSAVAVQSTAQGFAYPQPHFATAPQSSPPRPARTQPAAKTSAVGGPFISPSTTY